MTHRRGILWSVLVGLCLTPVVLFYGGGTVWSVLAGIGLGTLLGWLRNWRPSLFHGKAHTVDHKLVARQETAKAAMSGALSGAG